MSAFKIESFVDGDVIFKIGDPANNLYILSDGQVDLLDDHGVVFDQIREVISGDEVIDRDHFDFCAEKALVADCPKNEATDAPETIDADFDHIL